MSRIVHSLLLFLLLTLTVWSCTEQTSQPAVEPVPLHIEVNFEALPGVEPRNDALATPDDRSYVIESITARASSYDKATQRTTLQDEQTREISPDDTSFAISLTVPPGDNYTVAVTARGRRTNTEDTGTLYSGSAFLERVTLDTENRAEIALEFLVPQLSLVPADESYQLSWTAVTGAALYQLFEFNTSSGSIRQYNVTRTDTTLTFPPTFAGEATRQYRVRGQFDDGSTTVPSNQEDVQLPTPVAPAPIVDLRIEPPVGVNEVTLIWTATGDDGDEGTAREYDLRQSTSNITVANFDDTERLTGLPAPGPAGSPETYLAPNLLPDTRYYYALRAIDDAGIRSALSNVAVVTTQPTNDDVTPPDPVILADTELTATSVRLSWIAPGDDGADGTATRYELRRSLTPLSERDFPEGDLLATPLPATAGTGQSIVATELSPATLYYFAIRAYDEVDNASALTDVLEVLTPEVSSPPSAITDLVATTRSESEIELTWTTPLPGSSPLAEYDLRVSRLPITIENFFDADQRKTEAPGEPSSAEIFLVTSLTRSTEFYFAIVTIDDVGGRSPLSNLASGTTPDQTAPAATTDLNATVVSESTIELRWTAPGNDGTVGQAELYDLRRASFALTAENFLTGESIATDPPSPPGAIELLAQTDLVSGQKYFYALITEDPSGNRSPLSNVISVSTDDETAPAAVTDLLATAISGSTVRLTWTAPGDDGQSGQATTYDLRYSTSPITEFNFDVAGTVPTGTPGPSGSPESVDRDGFPSGVFYFALRTADENNNVSALSNVPTVLFEDTTVPNAITDLEIVEVGITHIRLDWTAPGDDGVLGRASNYDLRYSDAPITPANFEEAVFVPGVPAPDTSGTEQSFSVEDLTPLTFYYFALLSADDSGNRSGLSNVVGDETLPNVPTAPRDLIVVALSPTSLELTWADESDDEEEFDIEARAEGEPKFSPLAVVLGSAGPTGTYLDLGLSDRTEYSYRVRATNVSGASAFSNIATARTLVPAPSALAATALDAELVLLDWSFPFADPDSFLIEREESAIWDWVATVPGQDRDFADGTVEFLTSYNYRVLAIDEKSSDYSNIASVTTPDEAPICTIIPLSLDFGDIPLGTTKIDSVTITNTGGDLLTGTAVFQSCPHFFVVSGGSSFGLGRNQSRTVIIEYDPITAGIHSCDLLTGSECASVPIFGSASNPVDNFWWDGFDAYPNGSGLNAEVRSMTVGGTKLIVGGAFDEAGGIVANRVVSWSGTSWVAEETTGDYLSGGPVSTVSFLQDGPDAYIIAGGEFGVSGSNPVRYAERSFGEWNSFLPAPNAALQATLPVGIEVWVGGLFTDIPGTSPPQRFISLFSDDSWLEVGDFNGPVYALAQHDGFVVAGGSFTLVDGQPRSHVTVDYIKEWGQLGLGFDGTVYVLASIDGFLYAGGDFTIAGSSPAYGIAKWDGLNWQGIDLGIDFGVVYTIEKFGNDIAIGGDFVTTNGAGDPLNRVALYDGLAWLPLGPGISNGVVNSLRSFQGSLYAGGSFTSAGLKPSYYIARWDPVAGRR